MGWHCEVKWVVGEWLVAGLVRVVGRQRAWAVQRTDRGCGGTQGEGMG